MYRSYSHNAYPFLYGISAGFIIRLVFIYIKKYLLLRKWMKRYSSNVCKCNFFFAMQNNYTRNYLVCIAGEAV